MIESILHYWFGDLQGPHDVDRSKNALWWSGGSEVDEEVRARFGETVARALAGELDAWAETPRGALALVIALDQFTRNLGRGTPRAFAGDAKALQITLAAIEAGHDRALRPIERSFLYMPMMHAEDRAMARRSVETFAALSKEIAALPTDDHPDFHSHAVTHAEIVQRFGRYPHRNAILGRTPTEAERQFLADGGPSFGQTARDASDDEG